MNPDDDTLPATPLDTGAAQRSSEIPTTVGRFTVEAKLGEGGMGVVLLATDPLLGRRVAIKVLRGVAFDESAKRRLIREAQGTAQLSHENIIVVHEVGTHDDQVYLAMEYIAGETLRRRQAHRGWREILDLYLRAGAGLQAAHDAGLVHRDFKPDNVLVAADGRLRVTDFGLVAATDAEPDPAARTPVAKAPVPRSAADLTSTLTQTGALLGTPRYMAPEQHAGEPVDARADQFAFCVALYEALFGQPPFAGTTLAELSANVLAGTVTPPPSSDVPLPVQEAVLRGLRRDRNDRHPSMRDLLLLLATEPPAAPRRSRWPLLVGIGGGAIASIALVLALRTRPEETVPPAPPPAPPAVAAPSSRLDVTSIGKAVASFDQGNVSFRSGAYDEAAKSFEDTYAALKVPQALYNRGASFFMKAKRDGDAPSYRRAAESYTQYLASDPMAPGVGSAIEAINLEADRLEAGGDRHSPSPAIQSLVDPDLRGFVLFVSEPTESTVYVDDIAKGPVGTTPWSGTLDGTHTIYLAKPGYKQLEQTGTYDRQKLMVLRGVLAPVTSR